MNGTKALDLIKVQLDDLVAAGAAELAEAWARFDAVKAECQSSRDLLLVIAAQRDDYRSMLKHISKRIPPHYERFTANDDASFGELECHVIDMAGDLQAVAEAVRIAYEILGDSPHADEYTAKAEAVIAAAVKRIDRVRNTQERPEAPLAQADGGDGHAKEAEVSGNVSRGEPTGTMRLTPSTTEPAKLGDDGAPSIVSAISDHPDDLPF